MRVTGTELNAFGALSSRDEWCYSRVRPESVILTRVEKTALQELAAYRYYSVWPSKVLWSRHEEINDLYPLLCSWKLVQYNLSMSSPQDMTWWSIALDLAHTTSRVWKTSQCILFADSWCSWSIRRCAILFGTKKCTCSRGKMRCCLVVLAKRFVWSFAFDVLFSLVKEE